MNSFSTTPPGLDAPNPVETNIFAHSHKAIRQGLAELLCRLGSVDWENATERTQGGHEIESLLGFCELHLQLEEDVIRPACGDSLVPDAFDTGHPVHRRLIAETRALVRAVEASPKPHRTSLGHVLYLHFSVFVADCLQHMAEEERVLLPLMLRALGEKQMLAIHQRVVSAVPAAARAESARRMLVAGNPAERRALTLAMVAHGPRAMVLDLLESVRSRLDAATFEELAHLTEAEPAEVAS